MSPTTFNWLILQAVFLIPPSTPRSPSSGTSPTQSSCTDPNACFDRVALLVNDASFRVDNNGGATAGTTLNRLNFFPGCSGQNNDYIFYYGTNAQVNTLLQNLKICPVNNTLNATTAFFYHDQVPRNNTSPNGVATTDNQGTSTLTPNNLVTCGFQVPSRKRDGSQLRRYLPGSSSTTPLLTSCPQSRARCSTSATASRSSLPTTDLTSELSSVTPQSALRSSSLKTASSSYQAFPDSLALSYVLTIVITDPSNVFLEKRVDVLIPPFVAGDAPSAGFIRLVTRNGNVCGFNDTLCINNQVRLNGTVNVVVRDLGAQTLAGTTPPLQGVNVSLANQFSPNATTFRSQTTDNDGRTNFTFIPYGALTVTAVKTGYRPSYSFVDLQKRHCPGTFDHSQTY